MKNDVTFAKFASIKSAFAAVSAASFSFRHFLPEYHIEGMGFGQVRNFLLSWDDWNNISQVVSLGEGFSVVLGCGLEFQFQPLTKGQVKVAAIVPRSFHSVRLPLRKAGFNIPLRRDAQARRDARRDASACAEVSATEVYTTWGHLAIREAAASFPPAIAAILNRRASALEVEASRPERRDRRARRTGARHARGQRAVQ